MALITELPRKEQVYDSDVLVVDDGTHSYQVPFSLLKGLLGSVASFEADPEQAAYPGALKLTLTNGAVLRAYCPDPAKQDKLTFDNVPTSGSDNPVKSGGVFTALGDKLDSADYVAFRGASGQEAGAAGIVPAPAAGGMYLGSDGAWMTPDTAPTAASVRLITSGAVHTALAGKAGTEDVNAKYTKPADGIPASDMAEAVRKALVLAASALQDDDVDDALDPDSENPVQNKVVTEALGQKADSDAVYSKEAVNARDDALYAAILSGGGDYKATMRSFFLANGALLLTDLSDLCDRWYKLSRTGWTGGVRFSQPEEGVTMSSDGTKTGDNAGLSCTPSTTTEANRDDYAALPLFAVVDCNVTPDSNGKPHVTAIDGIAGGFQRYDPAKIVCCMQMTGWMHFVEEEDVFGFDYTDQPEAEGFAPLPEAVELKDNAVRSWVVHCKYGAGDTWGSCSGVPLRVWDVSHDTARTQVRAVWGSRYCAATSADDAFLKIMLYLKYAQLDSDRILHGCVSYDYTYRLALGEAGVERVLLTPAQAANLIVGSCVCVGTASKRSSNKAQQTALLDRVRIVQIETVEIDGVSYGAVYVDNGGNTFDSATTYYLYTYQWHTGATDDVLGNDGGINPLNDHYPVKLQGIEILSGCYEVVGDTILRYEVSGGVNCEVAHVCRDASKIATGVTADYKTCAYGTPCPASNSWQYPKRLGHDAALPEVMLGSVLGGSSTSGTRDGQYIEKYSANAVREWLRWGGMYNALGIAGLSCGGGDNALSFAHWNVGGRLSVTGNRGEYQAEA